MATTPTQDGPSKPYTPYVPASTTMSEFTIRALVLGLLMSVILGAANAYLGLKAGMTIAATYPAAVISMAVLKLMRGNILEENFARTVGSIGESVAAGAIFTIPAFVILKIWTFQPEHLGTEYMTATALMILGGLLGIMFVTILRRVMVEDPTLPFPESVAASEIHKAGQRGRRRPRSCSRPWASARCCSWWRTSACSPSPTRSPSRWARRRRASCGSAWTRRRRRCRPGASPPCSLRRRARPTSASATSSAPSSRP